MLSFIDGEVAVRPRPPWIAAEDRLRSVARLLRRYDDAVALIDFDLMTPCSPLAEVIDRRHTWLEANADLITTGSRPGWRY